MSDHSLASQVDSRLSGIVRIVPELVLRNMFQEVRYEEFLLMRWKMMTSHNLETRRRGMRLMKGR